MQNHTIGCLEQFVLVIDVDGEIGVFGVLVADGDVFFALSLQLGNQAGIDAGAVLQVGMEYKNQC